MAVDLSLAVWRFSLPQAGAYRPYVVDFVCHSARLVIEVDGDSHCTDIGIAKDKSRNAFLVANGYRVLRFTNDDVLANAEGVFWAIEQVIGPPSAGS